MDIFGGGFQQQGTAVFVDDFEAEIPVAASGPNYAAFGTEEVQGMTSGMSGMTMREEPECIKKWKLEQEELLRSLQTGTSSMRSSLQKQERQTRNKRLPLLFQ